MNPFDLLGDNDNDDPSQLLESASAHLQKTAAKKTPAQTPQNQQQKAAKLPTKPLPPAQAGELLIDFCTTLFTFPLIIAF